MVNLEAKILLLAGIWSVAVAVASAASLHKSSVDESSLLAIKAYISSDILASNWTKEAPFCSWIGIICGKRHLERVTGLDLPSMGLRGNIAKEIGNLTFLRFVDISNNSINGLIPSEIGSLRRLRGLNLSNNYLSGDIPTSVSACVDLKMLDLSHNNLSGSAALGFGNWSLLQVMSLKSNFLTGEVLLLISNLSSLEVFDISENSFYGTVVSEIGHLSSLRMLNLQANNLSGEVPHAIFNLSMLQLLSLRENNLSGTLPLSIDKGLPNIQQIFLGNFQQRFDLRAKQFYGKIPNSISNLSELTILDLSDNSFTHVPMNLGNLHQLQILNVEANHLTNNLSNPEQDFLASLVACKNLKSIQISSNPITGVLSKSLGSSNLSISLETIQAFSCRILDPIPDEIGNLSKLLWLNLGFNHFTGIIPSALGHLGSLRNLEIHGNRFHGSISPLLCNLNNLYSLNLAMNSLSGQPPSCLGNLSLLREIHMSDNQIDSNIASILWFRKGVSNVKNLVALDLSRNQLSGEIPSSISQLQSLNTLSLSRNKLKGPIVKSFADLKDLQHLDLSHNNLTGPIPKSLETLPQLNYFDVSFNELSGEIPNRGCFANFTYEFFIGNKGMCGTPQFKVKKCKSFSMKKRLWFISVLIVPVLVIGLIVVVVWKTRARKRSLPENYPDIKHRRLSYPEILSATGNLDEENLIGRGGSSSVYKGYFHNDVYAVKVYDLNEPDALKSFNTECQILSIARHRNLVKMVDCFSQVDFKALVMRYMPNGDLEKWLHSTSCSLNLFERLRIMIDVASAIQYLHEDYIPSIVHGDLNPKNILVDEDMSAHVGDFGTAKFLSQKERVLHSSTLGTVGYIAPEYGSRGLISTMVDVYSYGILLMEMLSRRRPTDDIFSGELTMRRWISESFPHSIFQIVDDELLDVDDDEDRAAYKKCLTSAIWLALECTADLPEERPNMRDVLDWIKDTKVELQIKLGNFQMNEYLSFGDSDLSDFENLEIEEEENFQNAEHNDRLEVITHSEVERIRPVIMSKPLHKYFHEIEREGNHVWKDAYRRFLQSTEEMDVGIGYSVKAQYFSDIENVNVDFEEHHINAYLAILHIDPKFAGVRQPKARVAIVDTMFSFNVQEIWMAHHCNDAPYSIYNSTTTENISVDELQFLLEYVKGDRPTWRNSKDWFDCDEVILVYNVPEHWIVCKLNLISCTISLFDSIQHIFTSKARKQRVVDTLPLARIIPVVLHHAGFWEHRRELKPRHTQWPVKISKLPNTFLQTDSHSCGPFAMMYVEAILKGRISPYGAQERIASYRQHIAHTIFRFSFTDFDLSQA